MSKILPDDVITITVEIYRDPEPQDVGELRVHAHQAPQRVRLGCRRLRTLEELPLWLQERIAVLCMAAANEVEQHISVPAVGSVWNFERSRHFDVNPAAHDVPPEVVAQCIALCGWEV